MTRAASIEDRFFSHVDSHGVCWEWTSAVIKDSNYGVFNLGQGQGTVLAHRWAWEYLVGPIPDDLQVDHQCRNHPCVNPDHFELVLQPINMARGNCPSARNARKTQCPKCGGPYTAQIVKGVHVGRYCAPCQAEWHRLKYISNKGS
jgi:hypothetical protein